MSAPVTYRSPHIEALIRRTSNDNAGLFPPPFIPAGREERRALKSLGLKRPSRLHGAFWGTLARVALAAGLIFGLGLMLLGAVSLVIDGLARLGSGQ